MAKRWWMACVILFLVRGSCFRAGREDGFAGRPKGHGRRELNSVLRDGPAEFLRTSF